VSWKLSQFFFFRNKLSRLEHVLFLKVSFASYFRKRLSKENFLVCHYLKGEGELPRAHTGQAEHRKSAISLKYGVICCMLISVCERRIVCFFCEKLGFILGLAGLSIFAAAAYGPLVTHCYVLVSCVQAYLNVCLFVWTLAGSMVFQVKWAHVHVNGGL